MIVNIYFIVFKVIPIRCNAHVASFIPGRKTPVISGFNYGCKPLPGTMFCILILLKTGSAERQLKKVSRGTIWGVRWLIEGICCVFGLKFRFQVNLSGKHFSISIKYTGQNCPQMLSYCFFKTNYLLAIT